MMTVKGEISKTRKSERGSESLPPSVTMKSTPAVNMILPAFHGAFPLWDGNEMPKCFNSPTNERIIGGVHDDSNNQPKILNV